MVELHPLPGLSASRGSFLAEVAGGALSWKPSYRGAAVRHVFWNGCCRVDLPEAEGWLKKSGCGSTPRQVARLPLGKPLKHLTTIRGPSHPQQLFSRRFT